jgi:hypothetical protein
VIPLRKTRSMRTKLFSRSSFVQSLSLVCDGCMRCPADLEFFFCTCAVQWGRALKLIAFVAGTMVAFFFFCSDISSFENEKVWVVPVVRKLFCADENWSEFVTRLLHESLFHCCCKAFFAYLNCCHWHCYSYSTSFKSSAIQLFGSYVPGPSLYVDCSHLKSLSLHLRDNIAFSLTGRLSRFYQGLFVAQMWGS